ncbi:MAG: hypothetical protein KatS3mg102_0360 [Planctomycetota bacterium]|nr:MAG: hypothetical protein KatS3mg102_0360 [Planctomycetota bacterium]
MAVKLKEVLSLVGKLDDCPGEDTPRQRFRRFLRSQVGDVGLLRDYVQECLQASEEQYNKALQDLVNRLGELLGFEVEYGRYRGIRGEVGFDGLWTSPSEFHVVVEVKTTETYAVSTKTLVGYVDELISARRIPSWDKAIGLYAIGRRDSDTRQIENAIRAEKRTEQLRVIDVEELLSLAELMRDYDVPHADVLRFLKPPEPSISPLVRVVSTIVAQATAQGQALEPAMPAGTEQERRTGGSCWLTPVSGDADSSAAEKIQRLLSEGVYAFGDRTPHRTRIQAGDWIAFYASGTGVVAHARVKSGPEHRPHPPCGKRRATPGRSPSSRSKCTSIARSPSTRSSGAGSMPFGAGIRPVRGVGSSRRRRSSRPRTFRS